MNVQPPPVAAPLKTRLSLSLLLPLPLPLTPSLAVYLHARLGPRLTLIGSLYRRKALTPKTECEKNV